MLVAVGGGHANAGNLLDGSVGIVIRRIAVLASVDVEDGNADTGVIRKTVLLRSGSADIRLTWRMVSLLIAHRAIVCLQLFEIASRLN